VRAHLDRPGTITVPGLFFSPWGDSCTGPGPEPEHEPARLGAERPTRAPVGRDGPSVAKGHRTSRNDCHAKSRLSTILDRGSEQSHGAVLDLWSDGGVPHRTKSPGPVSCDEGVVPPGEIVAQHSHDDREALFVVSGTMQVLTHVAASFKRQHVNAGDYVHVESGTPHASHNDTRDTAPGSAPPKRTPRSGSSCHRPSQLTLSGQIETDMS